VELLTTSPAVPELMGAFEAARELGVTTSNLGKLAGLPEPVQVLKCGRLWRAAEIRALARERAATREG
jgi:hypothetical protein